MMRWALVEAVTTHVRFASESNISEFYRRLAKKRGSSKAKVAAAAKMLDIIFRMLKDRSEFEIHHS